MGARTALGATLLVSLLAAAPAGAATINVTTTNDERTAGDGQCSLREAISTVDGNGNGDCTAADSSGNTIVLAAQTYPLTLAGFLHSPTTGCLSTFVPPNDDNSLDELSVFGTVNDLTIEGAGPSQTVIYACKLGDRALEVKSGATVTLRGLTITNGYARAGAAGSAGQFFGSTGGAGLPGANGGGILNEGTLTLTNVAVTSNHAGGGGSGGLGGDLGGSGGLGGTGGQGGGIFSSGTLMVSDTTISGNTAGDGGAGGAGVQGSTANGQSGNGGSGGSGGNGGGGGGIANEVGTATITTSTIDSNRSGAGGAAMPGQNSDPSQGTGGNGGSGGSGGNGAGIANAVNGTLQATNDTIEGNVTGNGADGKNAGGGVGGQDGQPGNGGNGGFGGGLVNIHSTAQLVNLTVANNSTGTGGTGGAASNTHPAGTNGSAGHGGGVYATLSSPTLQNTILNNNQPGGDCRGTITDGGHNLIFSPPSISSIPPDPCSFTSGISADPMLGSLADNGGPTQTMRLQPGSPAIDQVPASGAGCPATDQRGVARPGGAACDIGAYEVAPPQATTDPASQVSAVVATISATVTANAADATVHFDYGTSTNYGSNTADQHVSGATAQSLQTQLTNLNPKTTYHYRVAASSIDGTTDGSDRTFQTPAITSSTVLIKGLKVKPRRVHRKRGARVSYTDFATSTVHFVLSRCTKLVNNHCKHYRRVRSFKRHDRLGRNRFHLRVTGLALGRYRLAAMPSLGGVHGKTVRVTFRIVA